MSHDLSHSHSQSPGFQINPFSHHPYQSILYIHTYIYLDKLAPVPVDLSKLSDVVKNDAVKKTVHDKLAAKVNNIDTSGFVLKSKYQTDQQNQKIKFLILVVFLQRLIIILKLLN